MGDDQDPRSAGATEDSRLQPADGEAVSRSPWRIDRYRVVGLLGAGGMGEVYAAHDDRLDRPVAIKRVRPDRRGPDWRGQLGREAVLNSRVASGNVVQVYDLIEEAGEQYIVTEYVRGQSLRELCLLRPLDLRTALSVLTDVATGLSAAHRAGVVHRDLKTENVLVGIDGVAKIADFGIARRALEDAGTDGAAASPGSGTRRAMSPEQTRGEDSGHRTDLFAFGTLAYEVLAGQSPFEGPTPDETIDSIRTRRHSPLAEVAPGTPGIISTLVDELLQKDPLKRPSDCRVVLSTLEQAAALAAPEAQPAREGATRRHVAVACLQVRVPGHNAEVSAAGVAQWHEAVARSTARFLGTLVYCVDSEALVCVGFPVSHANNTEVAGHLVMEVADATEQLVSGAVVTAVIDAGPLTIATGPGGKTFSGSPAREAAEITRGAERGAILATARAHRRLRDVFHLEPIVGQENSLLYAVAPPLEPEPFEASELVGRGSEIAKLDARLGALVRQRRGGAIAYVGPAGIGKTRLARAAAATAGSHIRSLEARCRDMQRYEAFSPVRRLLLGMRELRPGPADRPTRDAIAAAVRGLSGLDEDTVAVLAHLCGVASAQDEVRLDIRVGRRERSAFVARVAADFIGGLSAREPVLLVFEDLHWSDHASLQFVTRVSERASDVAVLLVVTYRPEFQPPAGLRPALELEEVAVLDDSAARRIVAAGSAGEPLPESVVASIVANAGGVPLVVEELTRTVVEHVRAHGVVPQLDTSAMPSTLHDSVNARLDALEVETQAIARLAAVLGSMPDLSLLAAAAGLARGALFPHLGKLRDAAILAPGPGLSYRHALTRDVVLSALPAAERAGLHRQVSEVIDRDFPDLVADHPEVAALHRDHAGDLRRAAELWVDAGIKANATYASATACEHFEAALAALGRAGDAAWVRDLELDARRKMLPALVSANGWAAPIVDSAVARLVVLRPETAEPKAYLELFMQVLGAYVTGQVDAVEAILSGLRQDAAELPSPNKEQLLYLIAQARGMCLVHSGPPDLARESLERARDLQQQLEALVRAFPRPEPRLLRASYQVWVELLEGDEPGAFAQQQALEAEAGESALEQATAMSMGIPVGLAARDWDAARTRAERVLEFAESAELAPQLLHTAGVALPIVELHAAAAAGTVDETLALDAAGRMKTEYEGWQSGYMRTAAILYLASMADPFVEASRSATGKARTACVDAAGGFLDSAAALVEQHNDLDAYWAPEVFRLRAELAALNGDESQAQQLLDVAMRRVERYFGQYDGATGLLAARIRRTHGSAG